MNSKTEKDNIELFKMLTVMQEKTLKLLHQGLVNTEIAKELDRSVKTVEAYTSNLYDVLGVKNRVMAALFYERLKYNE